MGSSRSLAMRTIPGTPFPKLEIARKSIFTGISMARANSVRKKTAPFRTAMSFKSRPRYFSLISSATSRMRAATCSSENRMRSISGGGKAILEHEILKIFLVEHLNIDVRINRAQQFDLAILARDVGLLHGGELDVQIEFRQIKIRCERLDHVAVLVPL